MLVIKHIDGMAERVVETRRSSRPRAPIHYLREEEAMDSTATATKQSSLANSRKRSSGSKASQSRKKAKKISSSQVRVSYQIIGSVRLCQCSPLNDGVRIDAAKSVMWSS